MSTVTTTTQTSVTPLSGRYAGFWLRLVACVIDGMILLVPTMIISIFSQATVALIVPESEQGLRLILHMLLYYPIYYGFLIPYFALFEASSLQGTPGKLALGLIVTDLDGNRLSVWRALLRNLTKIFSDLTFIAFSIGYVISGLTPRKQALHDLMSGCLVIRKAV